MIVPIGCAFTCAVAAAGLCSSNSAVRGDGQIKTTGRRTKETGTFSSFLCNGYIVSSIAGYPSIFTTYFRGDHHEVHTGVRTEPPAGNRSGSASAERVR